MLANCKTIRTTANPMFKQAIRMAHCKRTSGSSCGSGGKKDESEICYIFPCCACPSDYNPSSPTVYDSRKYGHCLPSNDVRPPFDPVPNVPTGVFRCTVGEELGSGADKSRCYKCPEYFSYQHMSYYDMHLILRAVRNPSANTARKP